MKIPRNARLMKVPFFEFHQLNHVIFIWYPNKSVFKAVSFIIVGFTY